MEPVERGPNAYARMAVLSRCVVTLFMYAPGCCAQPSPARPTTEPKGAVISDPIRRAPHAGMRCMGNICICQVRHGLRDLREASMLMLQ